MVKKLVLFALLSGSALFASGGGSLGGGGGGSGTVTSVGLALPNIFSVSGTPVTTSGTLTGALATQTANRIWAGPTTGSAAAPTFRALVAGDIPALPYSSSTLTSAHLFVGNGSNVATNVAVSGDLTLVNTGAFTLAKIQGTTVSGTTGSGNVVFSASPMFTGTFGIQTPDGLDAIETFSSTTTGTTFTEAFNSDSTKAFGFGYDFGTASWGVSAAWMFSGGKTFYWCAYTSGVCTFPQAITGDLTGNASTATALSTPATISQGGTNITSYTAGDLLYATGSTTLAKLAKGTSLQQLRMNSGATAPEWATISAGITGTLTSTRIPFASGASTVTDSANLTFVTDTLGLGVAGTPGILNFAATDTSATLGTIQAGGQAQIEFHNSAGGNHQIWLRTPSSATSYGLYNTDGTRYLWGVYDDRRTMYTHYHLADYTNTENIGWDGGSGNGAAPFLNMELVGGIRLGAAAGDLTLPPANGITTKTASLTLGPAGTTQLTIIAGGGTTLANGAHTVASGVSTDGFLFSSNTGLSGTSAGWVLKTAGTGVLQQTANGLYLLKGMLDNNGNSVWLGADLVSTFVQPFKGGLFQGVGFAFPDSGATTGELPAANTVKVYNTKSGAATVGTTLSFVGANQTVASATAVAGGFTFTTGSATGSGSTGNGGAFTVDTGTSVGGSAGSIVLKTGGTTAATIGADQSVTLTGAPILSTAGKTLNIKEAAGGADCMGGGTMVGGTATITTSCAATTSRIFITDTGGTVTNLGTVYISAKNSGNFVVTSTNILDVSTFDWVILKPN